jgi:hypothetical protein
MNTRKKTSKHSGPKMPTTKSQYICHNSNCEIVRHNPISSSAAILEKILFKHRESSAPRTVK